MPASLTHAFGIICFALTWLAYDHYRPWVNFHSEALALGGLSLLMASRLISAGKFVSAPRLIAVVAAVACVPWLQWMGGVNYFGGDALISSFYLFALAMSIFVGYSLSVKPAKAVDFQSGFMHVLWIAAMASAAIGLMQWLAVQNILQMYAVQTDPGDRAMGNLGQPNQLATLLLMGVASYSMAYEKRLFGTPAFILGIAFLSVVLLLTESRTGLIGVVAVSAFLAWKNWRSKGRLSARAVLLWGLSCLAARFLVPHMHAALLLGTGRGMSLTDVQSRWLMWQQTAFGIGEAPWFGYGWNHSSTAHAAGAIAFPGSLTFTNAHNVVLDLLAWNGVPLGLLLVGLCGYWLVSRMRRVQRPEAIYALACFLPLVVHSMLEYPFAYAYFIVAGGLLVGWVEGSIDRHKILVLKVRFGAVFLALWVTAGAGVAYEYLQIEEDFRVVRFENLRIGTTPAEYDPPNIRLLSHMGAMLRASRVKPSPGMDTQKIKELSEVARRFPYGALALRNAIALGLNGDPEAASRQMAVIRGMYGEHYYAAAKAELRSLQKEKHPQLNAVQVP